MQINQAKFRLNGGCGYVLKPEFMLDDNDRTNRAKDEVYIMNVCIIAGRHVGRPSRNGISSPSVMIEVFGDEKDTGIKLNTRTISMFSFTLLLA